MLKVRLPALEYHGACQGCATGRNMHHGATGKIERAHLGQESIGMPAPMRQGSIYQQAEQSDK